MVDGDRAIPREFAVRQQLVWPPLAVVTPTYRNNFYFTDRFGTRQEKEVRWFSGGKASRFVPVPEAGSLLTRLQIGVRLARAVRRLHMAGLAHADLSNKNVLVDPKGGDACIIDIDSLVVPGVAPPSVLGTPGYIAPEVLAGKAQPSIATDKHALAVLLYELLLQRHPLRGRRVNSTRSAEEDETLSMGARALFIEHPVDRRNPPSAPIDVPYTRLGPYLARCFTRTFVDGLHAPVQRADAAEWEVALYRTMQLLYPLPSGHWTLLAPGLPMASLKGDERVHAPALLARSLRDTGHGLGGRGRCAAAVASPHAARLAPAPRRDAERAGRPHPARLRGAARGPAGARQHQRDAVVGERGRVGAGRDRAQHVGHRDAGPVDSHRRGDARPRAAAGRAAMTADRVATEAPGPRGDAFAIVAIALRTCWSDRGDGWDADGDTGASFTDAPAPPHSPADALPHTRAHSRTLNLLLDQCGSDHRALVDLLLRVGPSVREGLTAPSAGVDWSTRRAPLVHRLVATRYLQPDIARWLVESWAFAMGIIERLPSSPSVQQVDESPAPSWAPGGAPAAGRVPARAASGPGGARAGAGAPPGAAFGTRPPARPHSSGRATASRAPMSAAELARIKRMERTAVALLGGAMLVAAVAETYAFLSSPLDAQSRAPVSAPTAAEPPTSPSVAPALVTPPSAVAPPMPTAPSIVADSLMATPTVTGLRDAVPGGGVAGRYRVTHRDVQVIGSDGCDAVAGALAQQQESVETVEQEPGSPVIRLTSRGVSGRIEPDGRFSTGPDSGVTDGVRWSFTMQGRFSATGFRAQAQKRTDAIVRWHVSRSCAVVAELSGTRLPE